MAIPPDKSEMPQDAPDEFSDDYDDYDEYAEYVAENIGLSLCKRPSAKQKSAIVKEIKNQNRGDDSDIDYDSIFVRHAKDCFEPLYFTNPKLFSRVANIMRGFLPNQHLLFEELCLNDEDPPLHIAQLLKKPSFDQLAEVVKALREDDPEWNWFDGYSGARKLVLVLGNNFPELIKINSHTKNIFEDLVQSSGKKRPSTCTKSAKKSKPSKNNKLVAIKAILALLVIFWVYKSCSRTTDVAAHPDLKSNFQDKDNH